MKYITKYKSPNYNSRNKSKIQLIIIHYTALRNHNEAISYSEDKSIKQINANEGVVFSDNNDEIELIDTINNARKKRRRSSANIE